MAKYTFKSSKTATELLDALEMVTDKDVYLYDEWTMTGMTHYLLKQFGFSFRLRTYRPFTRNSFSRAFYGKMTPSDNGCQVRGVIWMRLAISLIISLMLSFVTVVLLSLPFDLPSLPLPVYIIPVWAFLFGIPWIWRKLSPRTNMLTTEDERMLLI